MISGDVSAREVFASEIGKNFSLVAPAGTGKTTSITRRVLTMALRPDAVELLPRLMVVTYTNKAADELAARCREAVRGEGCSALVIEALRQAHFSTIHGLSLGLIRRFGHHIGCAVEGSFTPGVDDGNAYLQWESSATWPPKGVSDFYWNVVISVFCREVLRKAILNCPLLTHSKRLEPGPAPQIVLREEQLSALQESRKTRLAGQNVKELLVWVDAWNAGIYRAAPKLSSKARSFLEVYLSVSSAANQWLASVLGYVASAAAADYARFRLQEGTLTFDDQVRVARSLLAHPIAARMIKLHPPIVILDEAQDTDAEQFSLLTALAADCEDVPMHAVDVPLRPGAFCMVGDPQQSIYGDRVKLEEYYRVEQMIRKSGGERLTLETTFRCSKRVVDFVNKICGNALDGRNGQALYAPFVALENAPLGKVVFLRTSDREKPGQVGDDVDRNALAAWLAELKPKDLAARSWDQVAILLPTRSIVRQIEYALSRHGLPVCNLSPDSSSADAPELAWLLALTHLMVYPGDEYEVVGVLREIFGLTDQEILEHRLGKKGSLRLGDFVMEFSGATRVEKALYELAQLAVDPRVRKPRQAVDIFEERLSLRQRLVAVCQGRFDVSFYETLRLMASNLEGRGGTISDFRELLLRQSRRQPTPPPPKPGHIQLLTCHAAKGLEWDCVILPHFFGMHLHMMNDVFWDSESLGVWHESTLPQLRRDVLREAGRREFVRLAYVSLTRAKRTLLIHDNRGSVKQDLTPAYRSFGHLLKDAILTYSVSSEAEYVMIPDVKPADVTEGIINGETTVEDGAVLEEGGSSGILQKASAIKVSGAGGGFESNMQYRPVDIFAALRRARTIARRILPHDDSFDSEEMIDSRAQMGLTHRAGMEEIESGYAYEPAVNYGLWWHGLMESLPWCAGQDSWSSHFVAKLAQCPDVSRGKREWEIFLRSEIPQLVRVDQAPRVEEPFFRRLRPDGDLVEGVIDWMLFDELGKHWTVLDWKTNLIRAEDVGVLLEKYRVQLEHYKLAVERLTGFAASASIYSTATGLVLRVV